MEKSGTDELTKGGGKKMQVGVESKGLFPRRWQGLVPHCVRGVSPPLTQALLAVLAVAPRGEKHTTLHIWWKESCASVECMLYYIHILFYLRAQPCCKRLQIGKPSVQ